MNTLLLIAPKAIGLLEFIVVVGWHLKNGARTWRECPEWALCFQRYVKRCWAV